jgi:hypothetical protein
MALSLDRLGAWPCFRGQSEWCSDVANSAPVRVTEISSRNLLSGLQPITIYNGGI